MSDPADLGVLRGGRRRSPRRELSSRELTEACLAGSASGTGRTATTATPDSINAWVRVYEEDALAAADRADERLAARRRSAAVRRADRAEGSLRGRREAADRVEPRAGRVPGARLRRLGAALRAEGMVLLGHLHTHEFACGGTTDQVGNPWALERSAGGSSGGSGAALASRQVPAATGTDTAGSLRIPSSECGTSTIKPTRGLVSLRGIVPLAPTFDHPGPMARTVRDCEPLLAAFAGLERPGRAPAASPLRRLAPDRRARPRRRRRVRAGTRRASGRAGRAAASDGPARRARRVLRPRPHRDAGVPPPLRRPAGRLPAVDPRPARARREPGDDRRGVRRRPGPARGGHRRLVRLARRAPDRRDRRADPADRRARPRPGLRRGVQRPRRPLADALLGLDGLPGRRAAVRASGAAAACRRASR